MASIGSDAGGRKRILFVAPNGKRPTIRLGKVSQRSAETYKFRIEQLLEAQLLKRPMDADLAKWVADLDARIAKKLAAVGLIPARETPATKTLGPFLAEFTARRIDVKPATKEVWSQVIRNLEKHFGADRDLASVTEADAEDFKMFLIGDKLAPTTVHKRLQFARMFFRAAKKRKLIPDNPFAEVTAKAVLRQDRQRFITREETDRLLEKADPTWQVIIALSRYGGLRCPSEVLSLRWDDIDWANDRIVIRSPKTEHHIGKASRTIPLFPELKTILGEASLKAPDGADFVVGGNYREAANTASGWRNCNLRTQFERIVKRAGLTPWPRLFHGMRATRETELARDYPIHVVTSWLGNTPRIALKHYLQVTDADFSRAATADKKSGTVSGTQAAQNAAQPEYAVAGSDSHETKQAPEESRACVIFPDVFGDAVQSFSGEDRTLSPL